MRELIKALTLLACETTKLIIVLQQKSLVFERGCCPKNKAKNEK